MPSDVGKRKCFVIMPFSATSEKHTGQYWTAFFRDFIQPALEIHGYHAFLSEDQPHNIAKDVVQCLATCDLVLAVLTDANPNVWYELGIRHSLRQGTIMIIEKGTRLPFDVHNYGAVFYDDNDHAAFISDLERHLKKAEHGRKDSPVADFLNNEVALIVNIAIGRLKESVECILDNREAGRETILQLLAVKQSLWFARGQVSIVEKGIILLHECPELQGRRADGSWQDIMKRSLYPEMQDTRNGLRITEVELAALGQCGNGGTAIGEDVLHGFLLGLGGVVPERDFGVAEDGGQHAEKHFVPARGRLSSGWDTGHSNSPIGKLPVRAAMGWGHGRRDVTDGIGNAPLSVWGQEVTEGHPSAGNAGACAYFDAKMPFI